MRVEVWSPDGIEAMGECDLTQLVSAQNGDAVCLTGVDRGARVWLDPSEVDWLVGEFAQLRVHRLAASLREQGGQSEKQGLETAADASVAAQEES